MLFNEKNNASTSDYLLSVIESNCKKATSVKNDIKRLKTVSEEKSNSCEEEDFFLVVSENEERELVSDDFIYYLSFFKTLTTDFTKEDILEILPARADYCFGNIIIRMLAEIVKEMKEINEFINEEKDALSSDELEDLKKSLQFEKRKREVLTEIFLGNDEKEGEVVTSDFNKIVLVPTLTGNIRVLDEIIDMPTEYYQRFLELVNSIINGTFKNFKRFTSNDNFAGICEVRGFKTRIIFERIGKNHYALVSAFIKKSDNDLGYRDYLKTRISEYRLLDDSLKERINDEEFMKINDFYVEELFNILENKDKSKTYKNTKGVI